MVHAVAEEPHLKVQWKQLLVFYLYMFNLKCLTLTLLEVAFLQTGQLKTHFTACCTLDL